MASRKRKAIDLDTKYQILQAVDRNDKSKTDIAKAFEIPASTLSTIIKKRESIMNAYNSSDFGSSRKKMRTAQHTDVEDALFQWFKTVRDQNIPISGPILAANRTLQFKGDRCHGGKKSKDRLTIALTANMTGTEKLKPLVIGKFRNPRCFKNVKSLPVTYDANKKAWMTSSVFDQWLKDLDRSMARQKRKILLFVDNCPAHPRIQNLKSVTLLFLPPNTTSKIQPMDQGIIMNFKHNYRRLLIQKFIDAHDSNTAMTVSVYTAILLIHKAWRLVTQVCILNCFRRGGFQQPTLESSDDEDDDDVPLQHLQNNWRQLTATIDTPENVDFQTYASIDDELIVADRPTEDDIVAGILNPSDNSDEEDEAESTPHQEPLLSDREALVYIARLQQKLASKSTVPDKMFNSLSDMDTFFQKSIAASLVQKTVADFFQ